MRPTGEVVSIMQINNNVQALGVRRAITGHMQGYRGQMEAMASGLRIKRAANDAAGLSISEGFRAQLAGLSQNLRNTEQAADLLQVAEGGLGEVSATLIHMRGLVMRAADDTLTDRQRQVVASEFNQLRAAIDRIAQATTYNDQALLAGSTEVDSANSSAVAQSAATGLGKVDVTGALEGVYTFADPAGDGTLTLGNGVVTQTVQLATQLDGNRVADGTRMRVNFDRLGLQVALRGPGTEDPGYYRTGDLDGRTLVLQPVVGGVFQLGPRPEEFDRLEIDLPDLRASSNILSLHKVSLASLTSSRQALGTVDMAIARIANERGRIGALQNRMAFTASFSENEVENMQASESALRDSDAADGATQLSRSLILTESSQAMLVQAFAGARRLLQLL